MLNMVREMLNAFTIALLTVNQHKVNFVLTTIFLCDGTQVSQPLRDTAEQRIDPSAPYKALKYACGKL